MKLKNKDWLKEVGREFNHPAVVLWRSIELKTIAESIGDDDLLTPLLDLGCGEGKIAKILFGKGIVDVGLDNELEIAKAARQSKVYKKVVVGDARNLPPLLLELRGKYPGEGLDRGDSGTLYVGDKGVIFTGTYGGNMHVVPREKMKEMEASAPPQTLPRYPKGIFSNFIETCRAGKTDTAVSFDYGTRLTEFAILGNLAQQVGAGKKLEWDGPNMKVKNLPELNGWVNREYRRGWQV